MKWAGILLLATAGMCSGVNYDGFRAKFSFSGALEDKEYFFKLPVLMSSAEDGSWRRVERPPGSTMSDLRMYCRKDDLTVCPLFDKGGFVAGIQIAIPGESMQAVPTELSKKFTKWPGVIDTGTRHDYWTTALYFVSEENLERGAGPRPEGVATLQDLSIWAADPTASDKLLHIPLSETDLRNTLYKKQNCIPNMGTHYYYNMTTDLSCKDLFPWFVLVKEGQVIGAGFQAFGQNIKIGERDWFEMAPARAVEITIPNAPACLSEWSETYGVISLHIYFVDDPWNIKCEDGDSVQSISVVNKLLLNARRYGTKLFDETKKIFSG